MSNPTSLLAFALAALSLAVLPGPAVVYIVTRSVNQGRPAGLASVWGVALGSMVHILGAAIGISAIFVRSAELFTAVKLAGAAYLIWIGVTKLRNASTDSELSVDTAAVPARRVFWDGFIINVLNPKTALFFLAFLPQFIVLDGWPTAVQATVLGTAFVGIALITDTFYALMASTARKRFGRRAGGTPSLGRAAGAIYLALGIYAALAGRPSSQA